MLGDYGRQLMRRYPSLRDDIAVRLQRLNTEWDTVEKTLTALNFGDNCATIRQGQCDIWWLVVVLDVS